MVANRGDAITQAEELFQLDPMPEQAGVKQQNSTVMSQKATLNDMMQAQRAPIIKSNEAELKQAQSRLVLAEKTYDRYQLLYNKKNISEEKLDVSLSLYQSAKQAVIAAKNKLADSQLAARKEQITAQRYGLKAAKAQAVQAQWQLKQKTVQAPTSGLLFDVFFHPGEWVPAGQPVVSLLAPQYMYVQFYVSESDFSSLKLGEKIEFKCDGCKANNSAVISYISPKAEYTPPVIYSDETRSKLVYAVKAKLPIATALNYHPGQPVQIIKFIKG